MRVLHVFNKYELFSKGGGVERYIHSLATRTVAAGHEVRVAAGVAETAPEGLYASISAGPGELWRQVRWAEIVHIHGPRVRYSALAGLIAVLQRRRLVYTMHCFYDGRTALQRLQKLIWDHVIERALLLASRPAILLSDYWLDYLKRRGLPARNCAVLPNGIDVSAFAAEAPAVERLSGHPAILSVSRLDPVKRIEDMIAALAEPELAAAELHIVGRGSDEGRLRRIAQDRKVSGRTHFHGFMSDAETASMAHGADVFVIASAQEGMPTTILEMLARGLPVVASDIPGNRSLMDPLRSKHVFPLSDVPALARKAVAAATGKVPEDTAARLRATFDWPVICTGLLELYR